MYMYKTTDCLTEDHISSNLYYHTASYYCAIAKMPESGSQYVVRQIKSTVYISGGGVYVTRNRTVCYIKFLQFPHLDDHQARPHTVSLQFSVKGSYVDMLHGI